MQGEYIQNRVGLTGGAEALQKGIPPSGDGY